MIQTDRVIIRVYREEDFNRVLPIFSDPTTMSFWPKPFDKAAVRLWLERNIRAYEETGLARMAVVNKSNGEIIGDCGIIRTEVNGEMENDLGYIIHHPYWKMGFGAESAKACLEYGFNRLELNRVVAN